MQPFDALSIRAVLKEARPLIVNRKIEKILQIGRDELLLLLRGKTGTNSLFISAQSVHGRICLLKPNIANAPKNAHNPEADRYVSRYGANNIPNFCLLLRKHLAGATLIAAEQPQGERIVDFVFSALDEVGSASIKILTAEIMGRHSNLIFWDKASGKIITSSHVVTKDMSRQREVAPGLSYERPPSQDRPSLYSLSKEVLFACFSNFKQDPSKFATLEQWLIQTFTGAGRHLCEELVLAAGLPSDAVSAAKASDEQLERLWHIVEGMQRDTDKESANAETVTTSLRPFMFNDLSRYSVRGLYPHKKDEVKEFPAVNDMVEEYFRQCEYQEQLNQLRERLKADLSLEIGKLESRIKTAAEHVLQTSSIEDLKRSGDLLLAHMTEIKAGQELLVAENIFDERGGQIEIKLNPLLSVSQNAQHYYRQYAKVRSRNQTASRSIQEAKERRQLMEQRLLQVGKAESIFELKTIKEQLTGKKPQDLQHSLKGAGKASGGGSKQNRAGGKSKRTEKLITLNSSDGWTIYVGRNRMENDYLLSRLAQPNDLWFHVLGQGGAHVLIRIPSSKQEPPAKTIEEAAQIAARLSKAGQGSKVRVVYTQCKHVRKIANEKPGVVRYENERTLEIDTAKPMPKAMKQLFERNAPNR
ncbi:MAG: NFACT family protein [Candidatus Obscuribacterales bacterium]|nr:NFACT family protein [Candidatus Obscuribacterales bacterium]